MMEEMDGTLADAAATKPVTATIPISDTSPGLLDSSGRPGAVVEEPLPPDLAWVVPVGKEIIADSHHRVLVLAVVLWTNGFNLYCGHLLRDGAKEAAAGDLVWMWQAHDERGNRYRSVDGAEVEAAACDTSGSTGLRPMGRRRGCPFGC